jgi:glycosyltransferase involved in cell wall biosynthesis
LRRSLSIIIPAFNEAKRLPASLVKVREYLSVSQWDFAEIVVVDDGSVDNTVQLARDAGVRVLQNPGNRGKGYSVKHGMLEAKGEWALFTDADLSAPIGEVEKLWSALERAHAQVAVGSRAVDRSLVGVHQPLLREAVGRVFNAAIRSAASRSSRPAPAVKSSPASSSTVLVSTLKFFLSPSSLG